MGAFYAVMMQDLSRPDDVRVDRRVNRRAAERLASELNARSVAERGPRGPLYYVERVETAGGKRVRETA